ncbi:unnamed protein product [Ambrosiozyma monospora]|uniref:Unnamed protein product n=1 Tax=Ambrosiozyma monospora TaxID=43982 RepID=A0ACB5T3S6_AMBMO|nr:unnamed protein product [Ambrosiozyma monospora]
MKTLCDTVDSSNELLLFWTKLMSQNKHVFELVSSSGAGNGGKGGSRKRSMAMAFHDDNDGTDDDEDEEKEGSGVQWNGPEDMLDQLRIKVAEHERLDAEYQRLLKQYHR